MKSRKKIVLAYSGGLDTSIILTWLAEERGYDVVAYAADLGQGEELSGLPAKARRTGASACEVLDLRETFVRDFVFPMLRMNAVYEGQYFLGTSIARPCIAQAQVAVARKHGAAAVSHGATGKGNDQVRFELTYAGLAPDLEVVAPWREWDFAGRAELIAYAKRHKIPIPVTKSKPWSSDRNAFHISYEGGILEDPWAAPPDDLYTLSVDPRRAPNKPEDLTIEYRAGNPVAVNGRKLSPHSLLAALNRIGGKHGIGRTDCVENRYVGLKSRGVYETPGGTILHAAHRALETITLDREAMHLRDSLMPRYAECVYYGYWFAPEREMIQAACDGAQKDVTGEVRLRLYKGNVQIRGRRSPRTLYRPDLVSFEKGGTYDQRDATGFIRLSGLRLKIAATARGRGRRENR